MTIAVIRPGKHPVIRPGENTGEAIRQANRAATKATEATASAAVALAAAGPNYANTAAGLAATSEGDTFAVDNGDDTITVYSHDAGPTATELRTFPKDILALLSSTATGKGAALVAFKQAINDTEGPATTVNKVLDQTLRIKNLGAIGDGTLHPLSEFYGSLASAQAVYPFATALTQSIDWAALQLACQISFNNASGIHPDIDIGFGAFVIDEEIQAYQYNRIVGRGAGTSHSQAAYSGKGHQTTLIAAAGFNGSFFVLDNDSTYEGNEPLSAISDFALKGFCARGNWTGPGDATNTTGRLLFMDDAYLIQNSYLEELEVHNFAEDAIYGNVIPLPGRFRRIWGRYIGGSVIRLDYEATRGGHGLVFEDIQGDFIVGAPIMLDGSLRVGASANMLAEVIAIRDVKHEIDSSADSTSAYSPDTIELKNIDGATAIVENVDVLAADPIGAAGTPGSNAILKITGTKAPFYDVRNSRLGSSVATVDYLVDDTVRGIQVPKAYRNFSLTRALKGVAAVTSTDQVAGSRVISEAGTAEAYERFTRDAAGKMEWGSGSAARDTNLYRDVPNRLRTDDDFNAKRFQQRGGTALVAGDFALSAGWGDDASVSVASNSTDGRWRITVTAGSANFGADPTVTLTFKEAWVLAALGNVTMGSGGTGAKGQCLSGTPSQTTFTFQAVVGTPTAGQTFIFNGLMF